jgi:protein ImuB
LRRLSTDRITHRSPAPPDGPLAAVAPVKGAQRLTAVDDEASRLGLVPGMALADARAMYPALTVVDADPRADADLLAAVADWCDRYTPLVGLDPPDGLVLDITGCAHLFGGEVALLRDMVRRLDKGGYGARVAIADTVGCAWAFAHHATSSIVPLGGMREAILPLPPAALRLETGVAEALAQAGLKRIADLIDLPRAALAARFGVWLVRRLDQALGREDEPITPRLPPPTYVVEQPFAEPIALERDVLGTLHRLAGRIGRVLEQHGDGARVLQAALFRTDGKVYRVRLGTSAPLRDAEAVMRLFADRLAAIGDACDPGFGFDLVRLSALVAERQAETQSSLAGPDGAAELAHLIDRLGARFGLDRVTVPVARDTHIPEYAAAAVPAHAVSSPSPRSRGEGRSEGLLPEARSMRQGPLTRSPLAIDLSPQAGRGEAEEAEQDSRAPVRPIRLFERPEAIEAIAEVPDGPPVRFRWRRVLHEIAATEGPERIAMEWWRDADGHALTRDYFRAETRAGMRVWLYREGLYGRETGSPRWFVHGLFG